MCVYQRLFSFIGEAAAAAKEVADVLVVSAFADVDALFDKIGRTGHHAGALDAWTAQVYRGDTFGNFFEQMGNSTLSRSLSLSPSTPYTPLSHSLLPLHAYTLRFCPLHHSHLHPLSPPLSLLSQVPTSRYC